MINKITETDLDEFVENQTLDVYQDVSQKSAIYPGQHSFLGLMYVNAKLNGEAGEFSEHVGKALRDDEGMLMGMGYDNSIQFGNLSLERKEKLILELGDVLWYVAAAARELGIPLSGIAMTNLLKLKSRSERNKLQGSGDNR